MYIEFTYGFSFTLRRIIYSWVCLNFGAAKKMMVDHRLIYVYQNYHKFTEIDIQCIHEHTFYIAYIYHISCSIEQSQRAFLTGPKSPLNPNQAALSLGW